MAGHAGNVLDMLGGGAGQVAKMLIPLLADKALGQGGGGFLNGNTYNAAPLLDIDGTAIPVETADITDLINNITIQNINSITPESSRYLVDSMNRIGDHPPYRDQARETYGNRQTYAENDGSSEGYLRQDEFQDDAMGRMQQRRIPSDGLTDMAAKHVKKKQRRPTDHYYCSRQPHEFDYCMKKMSQSFHGGMTQIEAMADAGDHIIHPTQAPTLGAFIDVKHFREGIELWRTLLRIVRSKNAKRLVEAIGLPDQRALFDQLIAEPATKQLLVEACTDVPFLQLD